MAAAHTGVEAAEGGGPFARAEPQERNACLQLGTPGRRRFELEVRAALPQAAGFLDARLVAGTELAGHAGDGDPMHQNKRTGLLMYRRPVPANGLPGGVRVLPDLGDLTSGEELPPFFKLLQGGGGRRRAAGSAAPDRRLCGDGAGGGGQWQAGPPVCRSPWLRWCHRSGLTRSTEMVRPGAAGFTAASAPA
ncbi:hypothetical protein ABPG77_005739 [Micractinium sp. CCAP 211/92]